MKRACKVCGTLYETCYSCEKIGSWKIHTDTLDHYYMFVVLMEYQSTHDAYKAFDALCNRGVDFYDTAKYLPNIQSILNEICDRVTMPNTNLVEDGTEYSEGFDILDCGE